MISDRSATLVAAVGFLAFEPREPELRRLHRCFDTSRGIGDIVAGMAREEYDLELRRYDRAIFFQSGFEHSFTSHAGAAFAPSPWAAAQRAAADALYKLHVSEPAPSDWTSIDDASACDVKPHHVTQVISGGFTPTLRGR